MHEDLIASIYEAGVLPDRWPGLLDDVARSMGAAGGTLIRNSATGTRIIASHAIAGIVEEFNRQGWHMANTRVSRLVERSTYPGFLTDSDLHTEEELRTLPIYVEFLTPHHADAGAATVIQGAHHDALALAIEGFADQGAARAAVSRLDRLRPHMARAIALSSQLQMERVRAAVEAFQVIGVPAATLDHGARIQTFNAKFAGAMGDILIETRGQMRLHNAADTALLASALERLRRTGQGSSLPIRDAGGVGRAALHIVPIAGDARDVFAGSACFVIVAGARNAQVPNTDLIQALFDMTPAEARVARAIALGKSPAEIASSSGLALATIRTQLKHIFQKTSTTRQSELASLLSAFRLP